MTRADLLRQTGRNAIRRSRFVATVTATVPWPDRDYLVSDRLRLLYAPIPKVASGNIKRWMLVAAGIPEDQWEVGRPGGIHPFAGRVFKLADRAACVDPRYVKVVFVRDPFQRLISAFLDKFVRPFGRRPGHEGDVAPARPVLAWISRRRGYARWQDVTFSDFAEFVCAAPDVALDEHWLPQHRFLGRTTFDIVGQCERLEEEIARLGERVGVVAEFTVRKRRQRYAPEGREPVHDAPIAELATRRFYPAAGCFYTAKLAERIARRYASDFDRFGYSARRPE